MNIRNIVLAIGIITTLFACGSQAGTKVETGIDNIKLNDTHKEVSRIIPSLQRAPEHVSAKRGEGFREYYSTSTPSFNIAGTNFNPSIFCIFNPSDELVSFKIFLVCEVSKEAFDEKTAISKVDMKIKGLTALSKKENMREQIGNDIQKKISIDMESTDFPIIEYEIKYLP